MNYDNWFRKCVEHGWERKSVGGVDSVTSPLGITILWDSRIGCFNYGSHRNKDFRKLVDEIIKEYDTAVHDSRIKIYEFRKRTKELREVIGTLDNTTPTGLDEWKDIGGGILRLSCDYGPLAINAVASPSDNCFDWKTTMTDGASFREKQGVSEDFDSARLAVLETLLEWCDELAETGRHAQRVLTKIKHIAG